MSELPVPLAPLEEQKHLVAHIKVLFSQVEIIEGVVEVARRRVDQMEQAIFSRAFRGELVPQDLDDEPASALREPIKVEQKMRN